MARLNLTADGDISTRQTVVTIDASLAAVEGNLPAADAARRHGVEGHRTGVIQHVEDVGRDPSAGLQWLARKIDACARRQCQQSRHEGQGSASHASEIGAGVRRILLH